MRSPSVHVPEGVNVAELADTAVARTDGAVGTSVHRPSAERAGGVSVLRGDVPRRRAGRSLQREVPRLAGDRDDHVHPVCRARVHGLDAGPQVRGAVGVPTVIVLVRRDRDEVTERKGACRVLSHHSLPRMGAVRLHKITDGPP